MRLLLVTLAALAGVFVLLLAVRFGTALSLVLALRFRPGGAHEVDPEDLPRELDPVFRAAGEILEGWGFRYSFAMWLDSPEASEPPRPAHVWVHDASGTSATLIPPIYYNGSRAWDVSFETEYEDGTVVFTGDSIEHVSFPLPDGWEFQDGYRNDVEAQWRAHLAALEAHAERGAPLPPGPVLVLGRNRRVLASGVERWRAMGLLAPEGAEGDRFRPRAAFGFARRLIAGSDRVARLERARLRSSTGRPGDPEVWRAAEAYALERTRTMEAGRKASPRTRWILLLVSLPVSALALGLLFGWDLVASILLVLLVHELGHALGMVLFGYKDPQIFFIPFLGAVATGDKEDASPFQELVVLLLGPVPGIVLGFWLMSVAPPGTWWAELALVGLVLNYVNLLPFMPLDGGRIVETVLLGRFPRVQFFFVAASAAVAGAAGWLLGDGILQFLAIMLALSLPSKWRWSQGARLLQPHLKPDLDGRGRAEAVYRVLEEPPFTRLAQAQRLALAKSLLRFAARPRTGLGFVLLGMLLYTAAVVGPPVGYLMGASPTVDTIEAQEGLP